MLLIYLKAFIGKQSELMAESPYVIVMLGVDLALSSRTSIDNYKQSGQLYSGALLLRS